MMTPARTLLLIDDDTITRDVLSLFLSDTGWKVTGAPGGAAALEVLQNGVAPAVVLCDLQMPGLCGTELAESIRAIAPSSVLLAMTATPQVTAPKGYDALLVKPFPPEVVQARYEMVLGRLAGASAVSESNTEVQSLVLDPTVMEQLQRTMSADRLRALLIFAADDADTRIARMRTAAKAGDDKAFRTEAHALKGSCGMVGAMRLKQLAASAEDHGLPPGPLTDWKPISEFVSETSAIRLMLESLSRGSM